MTNRLPKVKKKSSDHFIISDTIHNEYVEEEYLYYTLEESLSLFKDKYSDLYELEKEEELDGVW